MTPTQAPPRPGSHPEPPPLPPAGGHPSAQVSAEELAGVEQWFDQLAAERVHPDVVAARVRRAGWPDGTITWAEQRYRRRFPTHPAIWWGGFTAIGFSALACAGVAHSLIDGEEEAAAGWFGIALVAVVFAAVAVWLIESIRDDWTQRFSAARRGAATTLFWSAIAVAVLRGVVYGQVLGHALISGEECRTEYDYTRLDPRREVCEDRTGDAFAHLSLTAVAAGPIALWAWFGHRRPTDPPLADPRQPGAASEEPPVSGAGS